MKKIAVATFIVAFLSAGCGPAVTFNEPQPRGLNPLSSFPERLQGSYADTGQFSRIIIGNKLMTRHYDFDVKMYKNSLDSSMKLLGDTLVDLREGTKQKITLKGDTIIYHQNWTDTLFMVSDENILKKFKGYYFLNTRYRDTAWEVKKLWLKKGVLTIGEISGEEDIKKLKEITESDADTVSNHFSLTKKQFKTFIRRDAFGSEESFTKWNEKK